MLIKNIFFKLASSDSGWTDLLIQNQSAVLNQDAQTVRQGPFKTVVLSAYIPHISASRQTLLTKLANLGGLFIANTHDGGRWFLGNDDLKASFTYQEVDGGKAGSKSGYNITITVKSAFGAAFKSFPSLHDSGNIVIVTD